MATGLTATQAAAYLNVYRNTAASAIANVFVQLHVGDPGAAGTSNVAAVTTRNAITWNAPSGGSMTVASLSAFTGVSSETISHVSLWTASSAGTFLQSFALSSSQAIINGSQLTFPTFTVAFTPIAA